VRYVAEENIEIVTPSIVDLPPSFVAIAGKYFKRWDEKEREFVSNIRDEYPED
jgi:F-box protein 21